MNNAELVSIVVICYNSQSYIEQCLDSVKWQTYENIELVISDDASSDNTVDMCKSWLHQNESRFKNVKLVNSCVNTGVTTNCNRGLSACSGKWLKFIAGDDMMECNCISEFMEYVTRNPSSYCVLSDYSCISESGDVIHLHHKMFLKNLLFASNVTPAMQCSLISTVPCIAPTLFISCFEMKSIGGFDSTYKTFEDIPLFIHLTMSGKRIYLLDMPLVRYRVRSSSVTGQRDFYAIKNLMREQEIYRCVNDLQKQNVKPVFYKFLKIISNSFLGISIFFYNKNLKIISDCSYIVSRCIKRMINLCFFLKNKYYKQ